MSLPSSCRAASLLLALLWGAPLAALDLRPPVALCALAQDLASEVVQLTGLVPPPECPKVRFALPPAPGTQAAQLGEYRPDSGHILLAADTDLSTDWGQSVLLHELVHHAQHAAGHTTTQTCAAALETTAYRAQADFLRARGHTQDALLLEIYGPLAAQCGSGDPYIG